jgi:hypothetical protein
MMKNIAVFVMAVAVLATLVIAEIVDAPTAVQSDTYIYR